LSLAMGVVWSRDDAMKLVETGTRSYFESWMKAV
jgi:hypothetical protein